MKNKKAAPTVAKTRTRVRVDRHPIAQQHEEQAIGEAMAALISRNQAAGIVIDALEGMRAPAIGIVRWAVSSIRRIPVTLENSPHRRSANY